MSFYVELGDGRFRATERTSGPWNPEHQHAGPPSALLMREFEQLPSELVIARITIEILGPVPIGELVVRTEVERPGRSVELLAGSLAAGGREVMRARASDTVANRRPASPAIRAALATSSPLERAIAPSGR